MHELNILELYSGIGGVHFAMKGLEFISKLNVTAVDINTNANEVYKLNHPESKLWQKNICGLRVEEIEGLNLDLITMSPPCQPFTRLGLKGDLSDARTDSFQHFMDIFASLTKKPNYFLLENVKGFELSNARNMLVQRLVDAGFDVMEFLLSPLQFGIPNSRLRYYLLARLKANVGQFSHEDVEKSAMFTNGFSLPCLCIKCKALSECPVDGDSMKLVEEFLEDDLNEESFMLNDKILTKFYPILDMVDGKSSKTCCFTRSYGVLMHGSGSVLKTNPNADINTTYQEIDQLGDSQLKLEKLKLLKLRFFTPQEIHRLMCFPEFFRFPTHFTSKSKYKLLGNSVNVKVVNFLLRRLLS